MAREKHKPAGSSAETFLRLPRRVLGSDQTEELIQRYLMERRAELADALAVCESPMEVTFATALLSAGDAAGSFVRLCAPKPRRLSPLARGRAGALYAQFPLDLPSGSIRIDFALLGSLRLAIEIDGYDHHHRTKAQIARDNARDRELTVLGWRPMRFAGSEVFRDAQARAEDVFRALGLEPGVALPPVVARAAVPAVTTPGGADEDADQMRAAEARGDVEEVNRLLKLTYERARKHYGLVDGGSR